MSKVFNGKEFLQSKTVDITLSNGVTAKVNEFDDSVLQAMDKLGESENSGIREVREVLALALHKQPSDLKGIGLVEMRGAIDFLSENLFG